jgi:large subunit ribosomal protein L22
MPAKSGRGGADVPGVKTNEREGTRAVLRHSRTSAYKVRQVLDLIRGQDVDRAAEILALGDREAAVTVAKVLASAVANATHNDGLDPEELFVSACYADEGSTLKRWRPRARGRATRIRKRTSHITIIVSRLPADQLELRRKRMEAVSANRSRRVDASRRRADLSGRLSRRRAAHAVAAEQAAAEEAAAEEAEEDFTDQALAEAEVADAEPEVTEADTVDGGIDDIDEEDAVEGAAGSEESADAGADKKVEDQ